MTPLAWGDLAKQSVTDPAGAAETLVRSGISKDILWTALALLSVLSTILFAVSNLAMSGGVDHPLLMISPFSYLFTVAGGMVFSFYALFWAGRMMNGTGSVDDMMVLIVWLHTLHLGALLLIFAVSLLAPALGTMMALGEALFVVYVLLNFINAGHRLGSLWRAAGAMLIMSAMAVGFMTLLAIVGVPFVGVPVNA